MRLWSAVQPPRLQNPVSCSCSPAGELMQGECARNNPLMSKAASPPGSQGGQGKGQQSTGCLHFPSCAFKGCLAGDSVHFPCFLQARHLLCHCFHSAALLSRMLWAGDVKSIFPVNPCVQSALEMCWARGHLNPQS